MSHLKERKEKNCLNCQATLYGRYCHACGQENLEPKETVWHLIQHFFNDITHFDGKFFATVKYLLWKPGFLSAEYAAGRRASYLNPIRMYVFTSAVFFLVLYSMSNPETIFRDKGGERQRSLSQLEAALKDQQSELKVTQGDDDRDDIEAKIGKLGMEIGQIRKQYGDSTTRKFTDRELNVFLLAAVTDSLQAGGLSPASRDRLDHLEYAVNHPMAGNSLFGWHQGQYNTVGEYDSTQRALPDSLRDGWVKRALMRKLVAAGVEMQEDKSRYFEKVSENMLHSFPKILFWSLPFFALILNVLYFRHKREYYYVSHGIFTIHVYCATFLLLLACMLLSLVKGWIGMHWSTVVVDILITIICIYNFIYLYKAMRSFYKQRRAKTLIKYFITCSLAFVINLLLFVIFAVLSAINI